jgi:RNA polymerase sigma factor (TIGR02999 family)
VNLPEDVTEKLIRWSQGDEAALRDVIPLVYAELHRLAAGYLRQERAGHTLQATALVHETYLRLRKIDRVDWKNRAQFIGVAAGTMRRILVDHARKHDAQKRGGSDPRFFLGNENPAGGPIPDLDVVALDRALDRLAREYPRQAQVVELRFFGGLTTEETAEVLAIEGLNSGVSPSTVERDWRFARAWLHDALYGPDPQTGLPG